MIRNRNGVGTSGLDAGGRSGNKLREETGGGGYKLVTETNESNDKEEG